ncbi:hypothetical protein [Legionella sp. 16cNR16C]|uniref:hypothetical protein n=1 Tax=Legionella sp. 16cNR16C TaxID=2905656 RepID=UPI001E342824|nr:hypothetical protein [Legionella sp. 16cNR16C]MCE3043805.1 hypothetical protein [Legionella sp. 16cNR16C]
MSKIVLFIPFSATENNFSLYLRAISWRYNYQQTKNNDKDISIVTYRHFDETDNDYEEYVDEFKFSEKNCPKGSTVYLFADGIGQSQWVSNINSFFKRSGEDTFVLSVNAVAGRLKACGLTDQMANDLKALKLYICETNNSNRNLAAHFAQSLGKRYENLNLFYYTATLAVAFPYTHEYNNLNNRAESGSGETIEAGNPKKFRHKLDLNSINFENQPEFSECSKAIYCAPKQQPRVVDLEDDCEVDGLALDKLNLSEDASVVVSGIVEEPDSPKEMALTTIKASVNRWQENLGFFSVEDLEPETEEVFLRSPVVCD